jgi:LPS sulfotransferase NodH
MRTPTTFVVLTTQRSGSSWLVDLLNDHPAVAAYAELFRVTDTTVSDYGATAVPRFEVLVDPGRWSVSRQLVMHRYRYVRGLARAHPDAQAVGFKLMYDQTRDHPGLMSVLVWRHARFIHLVRRDQFAALVSFDLAEHRGRWWYHEGHDVPSARVLLEPSEIVPRLEERESEIERFRRRLKRLPVHVLEVAYEDLAERPGEELSRILRFLGVSPSEVELSSSLVRTSPDELAGVIENYEDVRSALIGTRFASELADRG